MSYNKTLHTQWIPRARIEEGCPTITNLWCNGSKKVFPPHPIHKHSEWLCAMDLYMYNSTATRAKTLLSDIPQDTTFWKFQIEIWYIKQTILYSSHVYYAQYISTWTFWDISLSWTSPKYLTLSGSILHTEYKQLCQITCKGVQIWDTFFTGTVIIA